MYKHSSGKKWVVCKERLLPNPTSLNPSDMPPFHSASMAFGKSIPYHYLLSAQFWDLHCLESQCHQPCQTPTVNNRIEILSCHRLTQIDQTSVNNCCKLLQAVLVPDPPLSANAPLRGENRKESTADVLIRIRLVGQGPKSKCFLENLINFVPLSIDFKESKNCHLASGKSGKRLQRVWPNYVSRVNYSDFGTFPLNHL